MPEFGRLSQEEVEALTSRTPNAELGPYVDYLSQLAPGDWAFVRPGAGENPRAVRRRLNVAAKQAGKSLKHHRKRDTDDRMLFQVDAPKAAGRRGRRSKTATEEAAQSPKA